MTIKKLTVIAAAGAVLLAGAIGISMRLTSPDEMAMEVPEAPVTQSAEQEDGSKTLGDMENIPLYYDETKKSSTFSFSYAYAPPQKDHRYH